MTSNDNQCDNLKLYMKLVHIFSPGLFLHEQRDGCHMLNYVWEPCWWNLCYRQSLVWMRCLIFWLFTLCFGDFVYVKVGHLLSSNAPFGRLSLSFIKWCIGNIYWRRCMTRYKAKNNLTSFLLISKSVCCVCKSPLCWR